MAVKCPRARRPAVDQVAEQHDRLLEPAGCDCGNDCRRLARHGRPGVGRRQNYLWFRGRKKQIIIHDGSNICPQEVEDSLLEHPAVASAGVIGIHDLVHGENVRAYITLRPDVARPTTAELIQFSRARVGYKAPDEIIVLDEMPMNAVGKVDRVALKELAGGAMGEHRALRGQRLLPKRRATKIRGHPNPHPERSKPCVAFSSRHLHFSRCFPR